MRFQVAIVIVDHLRAVAALLHEILPRYTKMLAELITEKLHIQPNRVFVIPEQRDPHVLAREFRLKPMSNPRGWPDVITVFPRSLTQHWGGKLIAVMSLSPDMMAMGRQRCAASKKLGFYHRAEARHSRAARCA
jgi:chemotaxis response regulator CheB